MNGAARDPGDSVGCPEDGGKPGDRAALFTGIPGEIRTGRGSRADPPPRRRNVRLSTLGDVAAELARLYRRADRGEIAPGDATKLAFVLVSLGRVLEASVIEARLSRLEEIADESPGSP